MEIISQFKFNFNKIDNYKFPGIGNLEVFPIQKRMWMNIISNYKYFVGQIDEAKEKKQVELLKNQLSITHFKIESKKKKIENSIDLNGRIGYTNYFVEYIEGLVLLYLLFVVGNFRRIGEKRSGVMVSVNILIRQPRTNKSNEVDVINQMKSKEHRGQNDTILTNYMIRLTKKCSDKMR
ncbi:MAG: hypothetical protein OEY49_04840 [Candidatus Heimdallarchaeota archaeon]|nr:hypothetical protein [Candidatus Heimdallarchaeota archaeon]